MVRPDMGDVRSSPDLRGPGGVWPLGHLYHSDDLHRIPGIIAVGEAVWRGRQIGIEGTGSYAQVRRVGYAAVRTFSLKWIDRIGAPAGARGKSDTLDAKAAGRAVLAGTATAQPKAGNGAMEMIRTLRVAHQSAIKARSQAANELHSLVVTAPEAVRAQLRRRSLHQLVRTTVAFRPSTELSTPTAATKLPLKSIAIRHQHLSAEIKELDKYLDELRQHRHCWRSKASGRRLPQRCSLSLGTTPNAWPARQRSPAWSALLPSRLPPARSSAIGSTVAIDRVIGRCISWPSVVCVGIHLPEPTSTDAPTEGRQTGNHPLSQTLHRRRALPDAAEHCLHHHPPGSFDQPSTAA